MKESDSGRCPALPGEFPSMARGRALEHGQVGRVCGVSAARAPEPTHAVRFVREGDLLNPLPS